MTWYAPTKEAIEFERQVSVLAEKIENLAKDVQEVKQANLAIEAGLSRIEEMLTKALGIDEHSNQK